MKARLQLTSGAFLEFDEDNVELQCPKCSEWFRFDVGCFDRKYPVCNRTLFNRVLEKKKTCLCTICCIADNLCDEIRMNTISEHDTQIRQEERTKVLDELTCLIRDAKESWSQRRIEMFHYTGLYSMIGSLRKNVETDNIESDDCKYLKGVNL